MAEAAAPSPAPVTQDEGDGLGFDTDEDLEEDVEEEDVEDEDERRSIHLTRTTAGASGEACRTCTIVLGAGSWTGGGSLLSESHAASISTLAATRSLLTLFMAVPSCRTKVEARVCLSSEQ